MGALSSRLAAPLAAAALLLAGPSTAGAAGSPVATRLALTPASAGVGDRIVAEAVVAVDRQAADPGLVRVAFGVAPLTALGPVTTRTETHGATTELHYRVVAACLDADCVPDTKARSVRLSPVRVSTVLRNGSRFAQAAAWPALVLDPRVPAKAMRGQPPLRRELSPPAAAYDVSPGTLALVLDIVAGLLVAAAAAGIVLLARRRRARRRAELGLDALEHALALVRESTARPPEDRRRALNLLAGVLRRRRPDLAGPAESLAWAPPPPSPEAARKLADRVEREVSR